MATLTELLSGAPTFDVAIEPEIVPLDEPSKTLTELINEATDLTPSDANVVGVADFDIPKGLTERMIAEIIPEANPKTPVIPRVEDVFTKRPEIPKMVEPPKGDLKEWEEIQGEDIAELAGEATPPALQDNSPHLIPNPLLPEVKKFQDEILIGLGEVRDKEGFAKLPKSYQDFIIGEFYYKSAERFKREYLQGSASGISLFGETPGLDNDKQYAMLRSMAENYGFIDNPFVEDVRAGKLKDNTVSKYRLASFTWDKNRQLGVALSEGDDAMIKRLQKELRETTALAQMQLTPMPDTFFGLMYEGGISTAPMMASTVGKSAALGPFGGVANALDMYTFARGVIYNDWAEKYNVDYSALSEDEKQKLDMVLSTGAAMYAATEFATRALPQKFAKGTGFSPTAFLRAKMLNHPFLANTLGYAATVVGETGEEIVQDGTSLGVSDILHQLLPDVEDTYRADPDKVAQYVDMLNTLEQPEFQEAVSGVDRYLATFKQTAHDVFPSVVGIAGAGHAFPTQTPQQKAAAVIRNIQNFSDAKKSFPYSTQGMNAGKDISNLLVYNKDPVYKANLRTLKDAGMPEESLISITPKRAAILVDQPIRMQTAIQTEQQVVAMRNRMYNERKDPSQLIGTPAARTIDQLNLRDQLRNADFNGNMGNVLVEMLESVAPSLNMSAAELATRLEITTESLADIASRLSNNPFVDILKQKEVVDVLNMPIEEILTKLQETAAQYVHATNAGLDLEQTDAEMGVGVYGETTAAEDIARLLPNNAGAGAIETYKGTPAEQAYNSAENIQFTATLVLEQLPQDKLEEVIMFAAKSAMNPALSPYEREFYSMLIRPATAFQSTKTIDTLYQIVSLTSNDLLKNQTYNDKVQPIVNEMLSKELEPGKSKFDMVNERLRASEDKETRRWFLNPLTGVPNYEIDPADMKLQYPSKNARKMVDTKEGMLIGSMIDPESEIFKAHPEIFNAVIKANGDMDTANGRHSTIKDPITGEVSHVIEMQPNLIDDMFKYLSGISEDTTGIATFAHELAHAVQGHSAGIAPGYNVAPRLSDTEITASRAYQISRDKLQDLGIELVINSGVPMFINAGQVYKADALDKKEYKAARPILKLLEVDKEMAYYINDKEILARVVAKRYKMSPEMRAKTPIDQMIKEQMRLTGVGEAINTDAFTDFAIQVIEERDPDKQRAMVQSFDFSPYSQTELGMGSANVLSLMEELPKNPGLELLFIRLAGKYNPSKTLNQQTKAGEVRAAIIFKDLKNMIMQLKQGSANTESIWHETTHIFRRLAKPELQTKFESMLGVKNGQWTAAQEEKFVDLAGVWLSQGVYGKNKALLIYLKDHVEDTYKDMKLNITPDMALAFEELFGGARYERIFIDSNTANVKDISTGIVTPNMTMAEYKSLIKTTYDANKARLTNKLTPVKIRVGDVQAAVVNKVIVDLDNARQAVGKDPVQIGIDQNNEIYFSPHQVENEAFIAAMQAATPATGVQKGALTKVNKALAKSKADLDAWNKQINDRKVKLIKEKFETVKVSRNPIGRVAQMKDDIGTPREKFYIVDKTYDNGRYGITDPNDPTATYEVGVDDIVVDYANPSQVFIGLPVESTSKTSKDKVILNSMLKSDLNALAAEYGVVAPEGKNKMEIIREIETSTNMKVQIEIPAGLSSRELSSGLRQGFIDTFNYYKYPSRWVAGAWRAAKAPGTLLANVLDTWYTPYIARLGERGGAVGEQIQYLANEALYTINVYTGKFNDQLDMVNFYRITSGAPGIFHKKGVRLNAEQANAALEELRELVPIDREDGTTSHGAHTKFALAMEGKLTTPLSKNAQLMVDWSRDIALTTGAEAEALGITLTSSDAKSERRFIHTKGGKAMARIATPDFWEILHLPPNAEAYVILEDALIDANKGMMDPHLVQKNLALVRSRSITKEASLEVERFFDAIPTHIKVGGRYIEILNSSPRKVAEATIKRVSSRIGFIQSFGSGEIGAAMVNQLREQYAKAGGSIKDFDAVIRGLNDMPIKVSQMFLPDAVRDQEFYFRRYMKALWSIQKTSLLQGSAIPNLYESMGTLQAFVGHERVTAAIKDIIAHPELRRSYETEMIRYNAISKHVADYTINPASASETISRMYREASGTIFMHIQANEFNEFLSAVAGIKMLEDLERGQMTDLDAVRLRTMGFNEREIADAVNGQISDEFRAKFYRVVPQRAMGSTSHPIEKSVAANTPWYKALIAFDQYAQQKFARTTEVLAVLRNADPSDVDFDAKMQLVGEYFGGTAGAGAASVITRAFVYGGIAGLAGLGERTNDPEERNRVFAEMFLYSLFGGPFEAAMRGMSQYGVTPLESLVNLSPSVSMAFTLLDVQAGRGRYQRTPMIGRIANVMATTARGYRPIKNLAHVIGIGNYSAENTALVKEFYRWKRNNVRGTKVEMDKSEQDKLHFIWEMSAAAKALTGTERTIFDRKSYEEHLEAALGTGATLEQVKSSLSAKMLLGNMSLEDIERAKKHFTPERYKKLLWFDQMIKYQLEQIDYDIEERNKGLE